VVGHANAGLAVISLQIAVSHGKPAGPAISLIESRRSADRVASTMESNDHQLTTRLADLAERLDRLERGGPMVAGPVLAKLEQPSVRLDRIEQGAAVAFRLAPSAAPPTSATPAARSATGRVEAPRSTSPALNVQGLSEARKIPNRVVREVIDGKAILQGRGRDWRIPGRPRPGCRPRPVDCASRRPLDRRYEERGDRRPLTSVLHPIPPER
jgi:hypothetical protein